MTDPMAAAAATAITQMQTEMARVKRLRRDLRVAKARVADLELVARRIIALLPKGEQGAPGTRLRALTNAHRRTRDAAEHSRTATVHAFLRESAGAEIRPKDLERALRMAGHAIPDRRYAARVLGRKADQGMVKRVGRGVYTAAQ